MKNGRRYLLRGVVFLIACLILSGVVTSTRSEDDIIYAFGQSFVVIGWVALWKPIEFYLYDRRDIINEREMLRELETIQVETRRWNKNLESETLELM